jgi:hypothetical protein
MKDSKYRTWSIMHFCLFHAMTRYPFPLKGPKREIFGFGFFTQIKPIWIGYLGTRPKNPNNLRLGPYIALYFPRFLC